MEFGTLDRADEEQWLAFVGSVFNVPSTYFKNHIYNDDGENFQHIFVAKENNVITGTVRVFQRVTYHKNQRIATGGIGEVSVSPDHRRKGIASKLLRMAIEHMEKGNPSPVDESKSVWSSLHTGEVAPLYIGLGWESVPHQYNKLDFSSFVETPQQSEIQFRATDFNDTDIQGLRSVYHQSAKRYSGCLERASDHYWRSWVQSTNKNVVVAEKDGEIIGYLSAAVKSWRRFPDKSFLLITDFSVNDSSYESDKGEGLFANLLSNWYKMYSSTVEGVDSSILSSIVIPAAVCSTWKLPNELLWEEKGLLYRTMTPDSVPVNTISPADHVFWNIDSF